MQGAFIRRQVTAGPNQRGLVACLVFALCLVAPTSANAATVSNGGFETGNLSGWQHQASGGGTSNWFTYSGTSSPINAYTIAPPPQGNFAAVTDQNSPGNRILYQDIALEPGFTHKLSLYVYYSSNAPIAHPSPDSLDNTGPANQQYRIDVMKPSASLTSLDPADILLTIFRTATGDPQVLAPTLMTADLTPFGGQTVRLRFAEVDNTGGFNASTDAVSITSTPPSNAFTFGKLKRNKKMGTATQSVDVLGPGTLTVSGKGLVKQRPSQTSSSVRLAKTVGAAGTASMTIKAKGKAKKKLNKIGKVKVKATFTFTPTGGAPSHQSKTIKLIKKH